MKITYISIFLTFVLLTELFGQQHQNSVIYNYPVESFTVEHGLSQSQVISLYQDSYGFIWIGTKQGLNRFDGFRFESNLTNDSYPNDYISDFAEDSLGRLLILGQNGIYIYDGTTFIDIYPDSLNREHIPHKFSASKNGDIWLIDRGYAKALHFSNNVWEELDDVYPALSNLSIVEIISTSSGAIIVSSEKGHNRLWEISNNTLTEIDCKSQHGKNRLNLISKGDKIYVIVNDRLFLIEQHTLTFVQDAMNIKNIFQSFFRGNELMHYSFSDIFSDEKGVITAYNLNANFLHDVLVDRNLHLWVGHEEGLIRIKNEAIVNYTRGKGMPRAVWGITEDQDSTMWFSSYGWGIATLKNNVYHHIDPISLDNTKDFYMGSQLRPNGDILLPSGSNVLKFSQENGFTKLFEDSLGFATLFIYEEGQYSTWFGSKELIHYYDDGTYETYGNAEGLDMAAYKYLKTIVKDSSGMLWVGSSRGLATFAADTFVNYYRDNVSDVDLSIVSSFKDYKGNLWFGTLTGLLHFNYSSTLPTPVESPLFADGVSFINQIDSSFLVLGSLDKILFLDLRQFYEGKYVTHILNKSNGFDGGECGQNGSYPNLADGEISLLIFSDLENQWYTTYFFVGV